jgi:type IV secretory pathway VirB10-like protein
MRKSLSLALAMTGMLACGPGTMEDGSEGAAASLASGTEIHATTGRTISSAADQVGATFTARVSSDVLDSKGGVVIPAGATLHLKITSLAEVRNEEKETARVGVAVTSLSIADESYSVSGRVTSMAHTLEGQGLTTDGAAKTAVGAAAGGVLGRVVGGNKTGTVVGAVAGGAAGAVIANKTGESDVVVAAGTPIVVTLDESFKAH